MGRKSFATRPFLEQHFEYLKGDKCYKCTVCPKKLSGIVKTNFTNSAKDHLKRLHSDLYLHFLESSGPANQMRLSTNNSVVTERERKRRKVSFAFASTPLPMNLFRNPVQRSFLQALIEYQSIPNSRSIENDIQSIASENLSRIKGANYFGIELDHWSDVRGEQCLLVTVSTIDLNWTQILQVLEFMVVDSTRSDITVQEIHRVLKTG